MNGGTGILDRVTYASRGIAVSVTSDGAANDGQAGEGDNISNMDAAIGGSAADTFNWSGSNAAATLEGRGGNDNFTGGNGDDTLLGGDGERQLPRRHVAATASPARRHRTR